MRYIMTAIWALILSLAVGYVLVSMAGEPLSMQGVLVLAVLLFIATLMGDGILKETKE